ncbi:MAG: Bug family tripartite tricarboxylate transporter substrate binding protein [Lautropia sp.]
MSRKRLLISSILAGSLLTLPLASSAQTWPTKPVSWVVPFPPGGTADLMARMIAPELAKAIGQPVVVENRAGASARIAAEYVAKAPADGYTVLQCGVGQFAINPSLYTKLGYDPIKDFAPITVLASVDNVIVVTPSLPVATVGDFVAYAKANPGKVNFTSSGIGSITHLAGEMMKRQAGFQMTHVSYKGSAPAAIDTISGIVQALFDNLPGSLANIKAGKLKPIATLSKERSPALPDVPTLDESGFPGYDMVAWQCMAAPAGTPKPIIDRLNREIVAILKTPAIVERFAGLGAKVVGNSPEAFGTYLREETAKWSKAAKDAGIEPE